MTIDQAVEIINAAKKGKAHQAAKKAIKQLSKEDRLMAGGDLEAMAILIDNT